MSIHIFPRSWSRSQTTRCRAVPSDRAFPRSTAFLLSLCAGIILSGCGVSSSTSGSSQITGASGQKTTPTITWNTPAPITYGTPLSSAQLDASASVPGTFAYSPAAGTVPPAGTDTLSVTFTPTDSADYNSATASVQLVVNSASKITPKITWPTPASITYGTPLTSAQLDASASVPGTFAYSPAAGTVPPAGTDTLSVTFTPTDSADYNSATASVQLVVNSASKITPAIAWPTPAPITYGTPLSSKQLDAAADVPGTFTYTPAAGTVPGVGTTILSVTFTPTNTTDYNIVTASVQLVVNSSTKTTPTITWPTPAPITYGTALTSAQLDASASVPGTFTYSPAAGSVPQVGTDTLSVTFIPTDTTTYNSATASVSLVVKASAKTTPFIAWPTPAPITSGTVLSSAELDATASVPGTFVYSPPAGTIPAVGTDTLTVTFTPTDTTAYNNATASVQLVVNAASKTTPTISWATPAPITYGTALSSTQLDATASVPGTFVYSPAAGTIPAVGTDTLTVTFTPTDTTTYNSATASVSLVVDGAAGSLSLISCVQSSISGAGTDSCTVGLTAAAGSGGLTVNLASSNSAVTVPSSVTVLAGATSGGFTATANSVTTAQTAVLTATAGGVTETYTLNLTPTAPGLTLQSTSVAFGDQALNTTATQMVTLTSSGTAPLTISAGSVTGTGFSISGVTFPITLNPGQMATLAIAFDPTTDGAVTGTVTLTDNTSAGTAAIALSGTGGTSSYEVNLSWTTPSSAADPVVGYNIYRSTGGNSYQLLSSTTTSPTTYTDLTVVNGATYLYYVQSVDASGNQSAPSNVYTATIP
ncbi:MAG TPA: choice-of-anchor D domain-containing protein [Acidobacteriaceae bacterium]|nr:choice-of-anchor D domain-containing protein [Acidobacteriaceae bacterium]